MSSPFFAEAQELVRLRKAAEEELQAIENLVGKFDRVSQEAVRTAFKAGARFGADAMQRILAGTERP